MLHTKDYTTKMLDMEHMEIKNVEVTAEQITMHVVMERRVCECPACGALTDAIHDYREQTVKDVPIQGKAVIWKYRKRRYRCTCCGHRFYERNTLLPKWHRLTNRLAIYGIDLMRTKQSRKDIAAAVNVSPSTIARWLSLLRFDKPKRLPRVLSIDEFRGNTEYGKFQCIMTAPTEKRIFDILPTYKESDIYQYLKTFPNKQEVEYFVSDMKKEYISLAKHLFPNAAIVIDRFHVVRYCTWALENVRKRVQKKLLPEQRKYFKRSRKLLLAHMDKLNPEAKAAVERMLLFDRDLREAYLLKEVFYQFMASPNSTQAKQKLLSFRLHAAIANIPEFSSCLSVLKNWEPYILNAFDCPYSNGFTEGCNNKIKVLKRIAFGYRSFHNFRSRILLTC